MKKQGAYTLAEIIITMGIIGIISAMTLPSLFTSVYSNVFANRIRQSYSQLYSALSTYMALNDIGFISPEVMVPYSSDPEEISVNNFVMKSFRNAKLCAVPAPMCFGRKYVINGERVRSTEFSLFWQDKSSFLLNNGVSMSFIPLYGGDRQFRVVLDINNSDSPNRAGQDLWVLYLDNEGMLSIAPKHGDCETDYDACLNNLQHNNWKLEL